MISRTFGFGQTDRSMAIAQEVRAGKPHLRLFVLFIAVLLFLGKRASRLIGTDLCGFQPAAFKLELKFQPCLWGFKHIRSRNRRLWLLDRNSRREECTWGETCSCFSTKHSDIWLGSRFESRIAISSDRAIHRRFYVHLHINTLDLRWHTHPGYASKRFTACYFRNQQ